MRRRSSESSTLDSWCCGHASGTPSGHSRSTTTRYRWTQFCSRLTTTWTGKSIRLSMWHANSPTSASARSYCSPATGSWRGAMSPRFHQNRNHQQGRSPCG
uniref:Uncharacterized protein n=1 Tax=Actinotignum schaalii TaxID=59505 RepID=W8SB40_9ACTO|nr:hypothetical protein [Actinotignum schaalii]AHM10289.1 hypothetical protein [Actinotignum schaalii]AHM10299.1 hypothetical protein [Actinotignum schaalii]AHM10309.1 hypothetical protein [Actinotignum schaalii]AHM10320.1 hypothetical protein [Actinotignum schaalii]